MSDQKTSKPASFSKQQFLQSGRWTGSEKDIAAVVLEDGKRYTLEEAEKQINEFRKRKVK